MRLPGAKKRAIELSNGRTITIHEVRPFDIRMLYRDMTENLDGLSPKEVMDTIVERERVSVFRLFELCSDNPDMIKTAEDAVKVFDAWQKLNSEFFKPIETSEKTKKKYMRVETCREISYKTFAGVCKLIESGHQNADFYGWQDFQDALKYCETSEKQRINELATAICCAFDKKTWEKVNR